jgi:V8-like Glu-specific endopeptidase
MAQDRTAQATDQPLRWDELEAKEPLSGGSRPTPRPPGQFSYYATRRSGEKLDPRVTVEEVPGAAGGPAFWRVDVDLGHDLSPYLTGLTAEPLGIEDTPPLDESFRGLDGFRPRELAGSYVPDVERVAHEILDGPNGKKYRPLFQFPPEDRHVLTDTSWPWLLIGKITTSDGTAGSAALVGGRLVLTAKHVRPQHSIGAGNWWMKFVPHSWDGTEPFGSSFISDIRYPTEGGVAHDYMIGRLYEPLGDQLGWFGTTTYDDDWEDEGVWAAVGYAGDIAGAQRPAVQIGASINEDYGDGDGTMMTTHADLNHGESGGPFWAWFNQEPRIVGVVSGEADIQTDYVIATVDDYENTVAGGKHMVRLVRWGQDNWPV